MCAPADIDRTASTADTDCPRVCAVVPGAPLLAVRPDTSLQSWSTVAQVAAKRPVFLPSRQPDRDTRYSPARAQLSTRPGNLCLAVFAGLARHRGFPPFTVPEMNPGLQGGTPPAAKLGFQPQTRRAGDDRTSSAGDSPAERLAPPIPSDVRGHAGPCHGL